MRSLKSRHLFRALSALTALFLFHSELRADVVLNEILYHAPNDLEQLEFVELFNTGIEPVDLTGWKLSKGIKYAFPEGTTIAPGEFYLICKNKELFTRIYQNIEPSGEFTKSLSNGSDKINLKDADGETVDSVEYSDSAPWPVSADGYSASLERICPSEPGNTYTNWAPSSLSVDDLRKPAGSPGQMNAAYAEAAPPTILELSSPASPAIPPGSSIAVRVRARGASSVTLLYQVVEPSGLGEETQIAMTKEGSDGFNATIPGQVANRIIRYRVKALGENGAVRFYPDANEIRPAQSIYVTEPVETGKIPVAHFFNVGEKEFEDAEAYRANSQRSRERRGRSGFGGIGNRREPRFTEAELGRMEIERSLQDDALAAAWNGITLSTPPSVETRHAILPVFRDSYQQLVSLREQSSKIEDAKAAASTVAEQLASLSESLQSKTSEFLDPKQRQLVADHLAGDRRDRDGRGRGFDPVAMLQRMFDIEGTWFRVSMTVDVEPETLDQIHPVYTTAIEKRAALPLNFEGGPPDFGAIMEAIDQIHQTLKRDLVAGVGDQLVHDLELTPENPLEGFRGRRGRGRGRGGRGFGGGRDQGNDDGAALRPQGRSAFIFTDPETRETQIFDFVNIAARKSGYKVRLHKDHTLDGMTSINVLYEPSERTILNEALAYDLYRSAGNASQRAGYVRVLMDGKPVGHHLWFEQPNGAFFRHNDIDDGGNLYKVIWQGGSRPSVFTPDEKMPKTRDDIVGRHEKKSNLHDGYDDLIELVEALENTSNDLAMWALIQQRFDVDQVVNYFAVNALISHWDGFFNNYFLYHDTRRKKWTIYPWDQDSTWSQRGGDPASLHRMPLNFGAEGATPSGERERGEGGRRRRGGFGRGGLSWWREGGEISKPLLANPEFFERFKSRLKELTDSVFTEEEFGKRIEALESALKPEVKFRAAVSSLDGSVAEAELRETMASLREHLHERRRFIRDQLEQ